MPDYSDPVACEHIVGFFTWTKKLTKLFKYEWKRLYHACHRDKLMQYLKHQTLRCCSNFNVVVKRRKRSFKGIYTSPQAWHEQGPVPSNHFGPLVISLPLRLLEGMRFYVFKRGGRVYLLQREETFPLFGKHSKAPRVDPSCIFAARDRKLKATPGLIYEIILTQPVSLVESHVVAADHRYCALKRCKGKSKDQARKMLDELVSQGLLRKKCNGDFRIPSYFPMSRPLIS